MTRWAAIQPARVTQVGPDVHIEAALERVICRSTTIDMVRDAITGATHV